MGDPLAADSRLCPRLSRLRYSSRGLDTHHERLRILNSSGYCIELRGSGIDYVVPQRGNKDLMPLASVYVRASVGP